ncbi:putative F-box protein At1g65770 [Malus domestica]|uniref:putative F-box protein At1g65770 n=1 Tax=Malus domestica TaxID=3750 RepID=UPI0010A9B24D|nr:putative F-box protein At1g65770 isoform X1 [Malus domestica]XP_028958950.1 putative F-box protein At1g65770 isoform X2 [Malus domestica]
MDRDWAALPTEILNLVVGRLETPKEFSFVCRSWCSAAKGIQTHCAVTTTPMMLISSDAENDKWHLYNPVTDKVLKTQLSLGRQLFCGSSKGWLIVVDEKRVVSLINPFLFGVGGRRDHEKSIIRLPPLGPADLNRPPHRGDYFVYKATISEDPILNADNCIVMVMFANMYKLAFIRLNKDSNWTYVPETETVEQRRFFIAEVVTVEERFYLVDYFRQLYSLDVATQSVSPVKVVLGGFVVDDNYICKEYLVVCNEKTMLIVRRCMDHYDDHETKTKRFRVFELNISKGECTEKNTLGDVALFLGNNSSISVCASKSGYRANCIYFIHDHLVVEGGLGPSGAFDYGVYNVEEKRLLENPFHGDAGTLMSKTDVPPIWILPTYNL